MRCLAEGIQDNIQVELDKLGPPVNIPAQSGDRFCRGSVDLLHSVAYEAIDFYKSIANAHRREEYACDYTRVMEKLNKKWKEKELAQPSIPTTFPDKIWPNENPVYKKGGSRRRAYTRS